MEIFKIRTYGRTELAQLYCPALCPQAAFRKLNQWIDFHPTLRHELHALVPSDRVRTSQKKYSRYLKKPIKFIAVIFQRKKRSSFSYCFKK